MIDSLSLTENWIEMHENVCQFLVLFFFSSFSQFLSIFIHLVVKGNETRRKKISEWNVEVAEEPQLGWFRKSVNHFYRGDVLQLIFNVCLNIPLYVYLPQKSVFFITCLWLIFVYYYYYCYISKFDSSVIAKEKKILPKKWILIILFWKKKIAWSSTKQLKTKRTVEQF